MHKIAQPVAPVSAVNVEELRALLRKAFYRGIRRRVPSSVMYLPSYVKAVRRHYSLSSNNEARAMLAQIEGYPSWQAVMRDAIRPL